MFIIAYSGFLRFAGMFSSHQFIQSMHAALLWLEETGELKVRGASGLEQETLGKLLKIS